MKSYVARQPIFNRNKEVYGYELLYRDLNSDTSKNFDGDDATSEVLANTFSNIGVRNITQGKKAFINFTSNLLEKEVHSLFDNNILVIEILEDVKITEKIIKTCLNLKNENYIIALDDFVFDSSYKPLLKIADIIKVDFLITSKDERENLVEIANDYNIRLLAEKVETKEEFQEAKKMGYSYFQGYFFKKPEILKGNDLPVYPTNYFQGLNELNKTNPDFDKIAEIIKQDMSLSYKLLSIINSAAFGFNQEIESIKQALVLLGIEEVKKWFDLVVIKELADDKPKELIRESLIRARMCELLGQEIYNDFKSSKLFMIGIFSMIDVLMGRELQNLLKELPIAKDVKETLLGKEGEFNDIYKVVLAYESGDWDKVNHFTNKLNISKNIVRSCFLIAIDWTKEVMET
ncbi:EAL and HDOD domain-containing protein [Halanaerobacter jeridensis]|uniref:EAL and modified HD-GYP domain-containing signal transduction protein n=1 Tax=Halanaerobacter jeridensis TaxID=706427 RepID=A0A938XPF1_9FIRM|nr:HDOD domain-containing protein [Halanaerobacter jeridensis]MBM7556843.1 EAL and modified HD-GYP domain-containing signal transduction protein [Halanaerobacter jeridensis]